MTKQKIMSKNLNKQCFKDYPIHFMISMECMLFFWWFLVWVFRSCRDLKNYQIIFLLIFSSERIIMDY